MAVICHYLQEHTHDAATFDEQISLSTLDENAPRNN